MHVSQQVTRYGTVTLEGQEELRVGTSRFLPQGTFLLYKTSMSVFFLFWGVWWAEYDKEPEFGAKCRFSWWGSWGGIDCNAKYYYC